MRLYGIRPSGGTRGSMSGRVHGVTRTYNVLPLYTCKRKAWVLNVSSAAQLQSLKISRSLAKTLRCVGPFLQVPRRSHVRRSHMVACVVCKKALSSEQLSAARSTRSSPNRHEEVDPEHPPRHVFASCAPLRIVVVRRRSRLPRAGKANLLNRGWTISIRQVSWQP